MASKIQFLSYVPDTSTATNPPNPVTDANASYDFVRDESGSGLLFGDGVTTSGVYILFGTTATVPQSLRGLQYVKVASVSAAQTTAAQAQKVTGYLICRNNNAQTTVPFTISSGNGISSALDIGGGAEIVGISIHGTWT